MCFIRHLHKYEPTLVLNMKHKQVLASTHNNNNTANHKQALAAIRDDKAW